MSAQPLSSIPRPEELRYTQRFSEPFLDSLRSQGDPVADEVVAELAKTDSLKNIHDLLGEVRARALTSGGIFRAFLDEADNVPAWADFDAMATGQRMIATFPFHMGIALLSGSLVGGAVFQKMAIITGMTGMFGGAANRRLDETSVMVIGMAFPGTLKPGAHGHELLVRVRLLHAGIRRFLIDSKRFTHPTEVPINQQDLAITLALFGYLNVRSLARCGITFSEAELASYNLLWRYVGHVLGIRQELLPDSITEQQEFFLASLKHQGRPEKISLATKNVLDAVARSFHTRAQFLPYEVIQKFLHQSCRYLSGNEYVTGMQIEDAGEYWGIKLLKAFGSANAFVYRLPGGERLLYREGARSYRRFLARIAKRRDQQGTFRVRTVEPTGACPHAA